MLSENPPDAALQTITEITAKVKGLKGDIGEAEAAFKAQKVLPNSGNVRQQLICYVMLFID